MSRAKAKAIAFQESLLWAAYRRATIAAAAAASLLALLLLIRP